MKKILYTLLTLIFLFSCNAKQEDLKNTVRLKGQLIDMGSGNVLMRYDGATSLLGDSRNVLLTIDSEGRFDTTFVLESPAYFNIARNTLYLTPGDDLEVKITPDNTQAEFNGKGKEANTFLKGRLFPQAGSYLEAGENIKENFDATKTTIDSLAALRQNQLDTLSNVSNTFKKLEKARIEADKANSYISYLNYAAYLSSDAALEFPDQETFIKHVAPLLNPLINSINDESYLDVAVVRSIFAYTTDSVYKEKWFSGITLPKRTEELFASVQMLRKFDNSFSPEAVEEIEKFSERLENKDFASEITLKLEQATRLFPGKPAFDLVLEDADNNAYHLSDFKGKVLYIDLWATWCGPCMKEGPIFDALSAQYDPNKIAFLSISTDSDKKQWIEYLKNSDKKLKQYHCSDKNLQEQWKLNAIPRFILIDKDFNIINANAPRPSDENIQELLNSLIK